VRLATTLALGTVVRDAATFLLCFILAMVKSPKLALVTLSTIPLVVVVQIVTQVLVVPLYANERRAFAEASTNIERATSAISTVKAHNAQASESARFDRLINKAKKLLQTQALVWAINVGSSDFLLLGTFVLGFWYAAKIVRDGSAKPGDVMTVFWASILAANYLQGIVPNLSALTKGKLSMASLRTIIQDDPTPTTFTRTTSPTSPRHSLKQPRPMSIRGIHPTRCRGEFNLQNISFAYPSRPNAPVLRDITLFIPPNETTFIVGGSGSGKSTIAQLLLRLYPPPSGTITLDSQEFLYLDEGFSKQHIAAVQQGCILFDMSVHDNVAMGIVGSGTGRKVGDVSREEVERACKMAMIHDFIIGLPEGYDTKLGTGGSALSGGQRQRLAIARARIRDPTVLILDEATSALDATSRVQVFEAVKGWRRNRTTIVITHDLSQIVPDDFVYVMANGVVAEQGFRSDLVKKPAYLGVFARMAAEQAVEPLPPKIEDEEEEEMMEEAEIEEGLRGERELRPHTPSFALRPGSVMYLGILDDYARGGRYSGVPPPERGSALLSVPAKSNRLSWTPEQLDKRRSRGSLVAGRSSSFERPGSRMSRLGSYDRPRSRMSRMSTSDSINPFLRGSVDQSYHLEKRYTMNPLNRTLSQNLEDDLKGSLEITTQPVPSAPPTPVRGVFSLIIHFFPTLPQKPLLFLGVLASAAHGLTTPLWANYLSKLMQIVGQGGTSPLLTQYSFIVLGLCAAQGLAFFAAEYLLFSVAATWTTSLRSTTFTKVLTQDKEWFDSSENAPSALVQCLIKDADDMRQLMGNVIAKFVTFVAMVGLGIGWAMVVSWRLTLVGLSIGPVFAGMVWLSTTLMERMEKVNKMKREAVARTFYDVSSCEGGESGLRLMLMKLGRVYRMLEG
jgi:ATP-binding cassette subfamily B (MDR/TAP) protein 1